MKSLLLPILPIVALLLQACGSGTTGSGVGSSCVASFPGPSVSGQEVAFTDGTTEVAESFKVTSTALPGSLQLRLKAVGTPTGNLILKIEADQNGSPSGLVIENVAFDASKITPAPAADAYYTFTFGTPQSLAAGTYWMILKGNSGFSSSVGVDWMATNVSGAYPGGSAATSSNDSTWSSSLVNGKAFLFLLGC